MQPSYYDVPANRLGSTSSTIPQLPTAEEQAKVIQARGIQLLRRYSAPSLPVLSIIIPMYNTERWVTAAIGSALAQTERDIEVVLVDDGSTDCGLMMALAFQDERLTIITQPNQGLSAARNSGIVVSQGEFIGFLDGDDIWFASKGERHLALQERSPELGVTFDWSAYLDVDGARTGQYLISWCDQPDAKALARRNHVGNGSTPVVRRKCFMEAGLFDETLRSCEDLDMWIRISANTRFSFRLIPEVLTGYRVREGSLSLTFGTFVHAAEVLQQRLTYQTPGLGEKDGRCCLAQLLRITSRKALADGQVQVARRLLLHALRAHPASVLADTRGLVLSGVLLGTLWLPASMAYRLYGFTAKSTGILTSRLLRRKGRLVPPVVA